MRKDEAGNDCPETLGEYRDLVVAFSPFGEKSKAAQFLDEKIAEQGRDEKVVAPDSQMRMLLMPMLLQPIDDIASSPSLGGERAPGSPGDAPELGGGA